MAPGTRAQSIFEPIVGYALSSKQKMSFASPASIKLPLSNSAFKSCRISSSYVPIFRCDATSPRKRGEVKRQPAPLSHRRFGQLDRLRRDLASDQIRRLVREHHGRGIEI